ncbi:DUF2065 domain-containing protein [Alkalilimnicola sp. S0819]|uniref:DUF2065 domain-containing protein n=1 Tax=Alkalilimnicola sp. S0819 TaxID=2613922 RepID=UPI00126159F1|nr:DUF2065 domain-containing protein [Alkalilimnicola sp. S0819]KAB7628357.1 DUF2065 domain-containing protein [Alkalilimnicola sp. S0819]MPQ15258.1 DUF2065 family protein [Alkalilimnicola sp. S0819]
MWQDLFSALALVLVLEGIMPFLSPDGLRRSLLGIARLDDRVLRVMGLGSMLLGALLLYLVRH